MIDLTPWFDTTMRISESNIPHFLSKWLVALTFSPLELPGPSPPYCSHTTTLWIIWQSNWFMNAFGDIIRPRYEQSFAFQKLKMITPAHTKNICCEPFYKTTFIKALSILSAQFWVTLYRSVQSILLLFAPEIRIGECTGTRRCSSQYESWYSRIKLINLKPFSKQGLKIKKKQNWGYSIYIDIV